MGRAAQILSRVTKQYFINPRFRKKLWHAGRNDVFEDVYEEYIACELAPRSVLEYTARNVIPEKMLTNRNV